MPPTETRLPPWKIDLSTTRDSSKGISRLFCFFFLKERQKPSIVARTLQKRFWRTGVLQLGRLLGWPLWADSLEMWDLQHPRERRTVGILGEEFI